jgi:hypothetical protein
MCPLLVFQSNDVGLRSDGQGDADRGTSAHGALDLQGALVLLDDSSADGQAETGPLAFLLGREERLCNARQQLLRNANAGVCHLDRHRRLARR